MSNITSESKAANTPIVFNIKQIGPLTDVTVKLSDLTILLGPPNTGKSYTLKSIYSALLPLDQRMAELVQGAIRLEDALISSSMTVSGETLAEYHKVMAFIAKSFEQGLPLEEIFSSPQTIARFDKEFKEHLGSHLTIDWENRSIRAHFEHSIEMNLSYDYVHKLLKNEILKRTRNIIPYTETSEIKIGNSNFLSLYDHLIDEIFSREEMKFPISPTRRLSGPYRLKNNFELREKRRPLDSALQDAYAIVREFHLVGRNKEATKQHELKPNAHNTRIEFDIVIPISRRFSRNRSLYSSPLSSDTRILDSISSELKKVPSYASEQESMIFTIHDAASDYFDLIRNIATRTLAQSYGFSLDTIRNQISKSFGIPQLRFIPFGRSVLIQMDEFVSESPLLRTRYLENPLIRDAQSGILFSYLHWLETGRGMLGNPDNLEKLFTPILQGELIRKESSPYVIYHNWDGSNTPLGISSALTGEVSGMIFPLLTIESGGVVLIEEPEAQLHPSAQFLMGLLLVALAGRNGVKIAITTHSDLLLIAVSLILQEKPSGNEIKKVVEKLLPETFEAKYPGVIQQFSDLVSVAAKRIQVSPYSFLPTGVQEVPVETLAKSIPSITRVFDIITNWGIELDRVHEEK